MRRRDAVFAFAFKEHDGSVIALRDHLGSVPLFYRIEPEGIKCSLFLSDLVKPGDVIDEAGLKVYLAFGTVKLAPLIKGIGVVPSGTVLRIQTSGEVEVLYKYQFNITLKVPPTFKANVQRFDELMLQAIKRAVKNDEVGVYLSGGIDSALISIYLKKAGVKVRAYTSLPWGETGTEAKYAKINAEIAQASKHFLVPMQTKDYSELSRISRTVYGNPNGITSQLGITSLWQETPMAEEKQIFFGQNADTMTCSVPAQSGVYFASFLPQFIRHKLNASIGVGDFLEDYLSLVSRSILTSVPGLREQIPLHTSSIQTLSLAGMLAAHSPGDGEVFSLPALTKNILFSNPYFDVDIIEFCLNQPIRNRLSFSRNSQTYICFEKQLSRALAMNYLPRELVLRKKGMTVPMNRDQNSKDFFNSLPTQIGTFNLKHAEERIAAKILNNFMNTHSLKLS